MKKIFLIIFAIVFTVSAFAETLADKSALAEDSLDKSLYAGLQFGIGVPIAPLPLSSFNWFVGYANKSAPGFWAKRFGFRADFAVPAGEKISAKVRNENDIGFDVKALGLHYNYNWKNAFNPIIINGTRLDLDGVNSSLVVNDNRSGGLVDFYPFGDTWFLGGIRFSGGYYFGKMGIKMNANVPNDLPPTGVSIDLDNFGEIRARLQGGTKATGKFNWKYNGPYGGIGWDIGVYRGFKFFFDAGVIYTNPPKIYDNDIVIPHGRLQACYTIGSGQYCSWTNLNKDDIPGTTANLLAGIMDGILNAPGGDFNGINVSLFQNILTAGNIDANIILNDMTSWVLGGGSPPIWYTAGLAACGANCDGINEIVLDAVNGAHNLAISDVQKVLDEYQKGRLDAVQSANDILKDFKFYPIVRLGVMYRF